MKRLLISGAAVAAVTAALAACGGGGTGSSGSAEQMPAGGSATVSAEKIGNSGTVLVDPSGKALYASDQEAGGKVLCTGACNSFWMPLTVSGAPKGNGVDGKLGVVKRPDGGRQVTFDGKLLYSFDLDKPGEVTGDGFEDAFGGQTFTWHVIHSGNTPSSSGQNGGSSGGSYGY